MTAWEERIIRAFAERYPASAAANGGRELRLRTASVFPEIERSRADERESFLEAAESLERDGLVSLVWERRRVGELLSALVLSDPAALFARLGERSPVEECFLAREAAQRAASEAESRGESTGANLFRWIAASLAPTDVAAGIDRSTIDKFAKLMRAFLAQDDTLALTPRALSVLLFSDSKEIERLITRTDRLVKKALRADVPVPDLEPLGRRFSDTVVAGKLRFFLNDGSSIDNQTGLELGFPVSSARRIIRIEPSGTVLSLENKETFYAFAARLHAGGLPGIDALIYVGGHVSPAVAAIFSAFAGSGFRLLHAGDLDPDGILILQELCRISGRTVEPHLMNVETFDRYLPYARELEDSILTRVAMIDDETRALPGIDALLARILATGRGVEQEII
jgi:hypothetical protein